MTRLNCGRHAVGPGVSPLLLGIALLTLLRSCTTLGSSHGSEGLLQDLPSYKVVHPIRVDARGHFLSNFLSHHARRVQRRETSEGRVDSDQVFYQLWHDGHRLNFNLTLNSHLLAPGFLTERRYGGLKGSQIRPPTFSRCHFFGEVRDGAAVKGNAAISTCDGLTGLFKLSEEEFFIQPLEESSGESSTPQAHAIYKRHTSPPGTRQVSGKPAPRGTCGIKNSVSIDDTERQRERWERRQGRRRRRIHQRSVSREKWVETLVVADPKMVEYHGGKAVEGYVLAVMNIVAGLFTDASIGNAINIVVVRLILLEQDEDELKISHHADNSLNSFCKWQKKLNMKGDDHPLHHDVAVLLTRKDICAAVNMPCETLGLSHVAGMCQPHRSCSISEDTGLPLAFTVAHELGHNFGIQHDGNGNDCEPVGKRPFVMSPQLLYGTFLPRWSRCSRQYITRFLDRGWGSCLDDAPGKDKLSLNLVLPGVLYTATHQCRLQYGSGSRLCNDVDNVCSTLWCTVGTTCHSKLDGAADGTSCGENKWCFSGECVSLGVFPESVHGGWGSWSDWTACSRTCGVSVRSAQRDCDNPTPRHRGKYCLGERRRYMICKMAPCPQDTPRFRDVQCGHFNNLPYKGKFYRWESVINKVSPCELHCRPLNEHFSEKMQDAVTDGTPCYEGNKSRDLCINGICKNIGCDYVIDSGAVEDRCGVCHGNGSTCTTVKKTFEESEGIGYVDIGLIPEGAREIRIEEVAEAGNFLALRSDHPGKYFLNGGWTIQWNGEYKAAGTVFTYLRVGHLENLTSPGPTVEPLWIQLLFQESNPGVRYEYTVSQTLSQDKNSTLSAFYWKHGSWSECSVTCGTGVQRQIVHCVEKTIGIVEEHFCDPETRPDDNQTSCNRDPCPAVWWVGEWHKCSVSCGDTGLAKRTVLCIQAISVEEQKALQPSECEHIPKPESIIPCNTGILCPAEWTSGAWSKCSVTCGSGLRRRDVSCSTKEDFDCDPQNKPPTTSTCQVQDCPVVVDNFGGTDWSGSGWPSKEVLNEINSIPEAKPLPKYSTTRAQPSTHNNLNDIVEGDFHFHNNIENGDQSKVHVDDFYYDYNFINFHEDLSADFDNDENDSGDSHGLSEEANKNENANIDIVGAPTTTPAISAAYMTNTEEPQNTNHVKVEHSGNTATNESVQRNSENLGDFLHEDLLLPVSTTHSPTSSTTGHSPKPKQIHEIVRWPENRSTLSPPESTTKEASQDVTWEQYLDETENSYRYFPEENSTDNVTLTPNHDAPTPIYHTIVSTIGASPVNTQEKGLSDVYDEYIYNDLSMSGQDVSVEGTERFVTPAGVQLEDTASEIPQSTLSTTTFKLDFSSVYEVNKGSPWGSDHHPSETSLTSTQKATPLTFPFPEISGNRETSDGSVLLTGTETIPLTNQKGASQSSSDDLPSEMEQVPARTSMNITTGTDSDSKPQLFDVNEFDFNEILLPPVVSSTSNSEPDLSASAVTTEPPMTPVKLTDPSEPAVLPQATPPSTLRTPSVSTTTPTSTPTRFKNAAYWVTGNWSACSTSCGLGAVWRTLTCSTGSDSDCDPAQRPVPAQRCYLRPCSTWKVGNWSKCSRNCEGGNKSREVQCIDLRDQRPLRPFHCQAVSSRPPTQMYCNIQPCLDWYTSSWGPCSEVCGGGEQQRIVTCLEKERCNSDLQPSTIQSCNSQPCAQWLTGSWGQCSASCGGGLQYRLIKCVNTKVEMEEEVDQASCAHDPKPASSLKCNLQECDTASTGAVCLRDRLTSRFCQTLFVLGRCRLANVRTQCCKTCSRLSRLSTTSRH